MNRVGLTKILVGSVTFSLVWAVTILVVPQSFLDGLGPIDRARQLFGPTAPDVLEWLATHTAIGAAVYLVCASWNKQISVLGSALFGGAAGVYVSSLLPPADILGSVIDWQPAGPSTPTVITLAGLVALCAVLPALSLLIGRLSSAIGK